MAQTTASITHTTMVAIRRFITGIAFALLRRTWDALSETRGLLMGIASFLQHHIGRLRAASEPTPQEFRASPSAAKRVSTVASP
jgi:hypothetical protein